MGASIHHTICPPCMVSVNFEKKPTENILSWKTFALRECRDLLTTVTWSKELEQAISEMRNKVVQDHCQEVFILNQQYKTQNISTYYGSNYINFMSLSLGDNNSPDSQENRVSNLRSSTHSASAASQVYMENLLLKKEQNDWGQQTKEEASVNMQYFLLLTKLFEKHFKEDNNQLGLMCSAFIKIMTNYDGKLEQLYKDIRHFSALLWQTSLIYYNLTQAKPKNQLSSFFLSDESMYEFFVSYVVSHDIIHTLLYNQIKLSLPDHGENHNLKIIKDWTLQDCDVKEEFRLDISTYQGLGHKHQRKSIREYQPIKPYRESIECLKKIQTKKSLLSKLKCIMKMQEGIIKAIRRFYAYYDCQLYESPGSEALISIVVYIMSKAQVFELDVHLQMIQNLSSQKIMNGSGGYFLVQLEAGGEYIKSLAK